MGYPNLTLGRRKGDEQYNVYGFPYYSGSQITVWFGDILIDDIVSLQWQRNQNKKPIYGYASQQFDAVAKGTVIIQGSFVINFRQSGYMSIIMNKIKRIYGSLRDQSTWPEIRNIVQYYLKSGKFGPDASDTDAEVTQRIIDIGNDPNFMDLAKSYEDIIWGTPSTKDQEKNQNAEYVDTTPPDVRQHMDMNSGFSIIVTYGNTSNNQKNTLNDYIQSTTKVINGVHLIGESQAIQVGGQNVMEQYDFFARGTDESSSAMTL